MVSLSGWQAVLKAVMTPKGWGFDSSAIRQRKSVMKYLIAFVASLFMLTTNVDAATCAERSKVIKRLENRFGEVLVAVAESENNMILELWSRPDRETYTLLLTDPSTGISCMIGSGRKNTRV